MKVKVTFDPEARVMYAEFLDASPVSKLLTTEEAEDGMLLDYNQSAEVIGVEILAPFIPDSLPVVAARAGFADKVAAIYRAAAMAQGMTISGPVRLTCCSATA